MIKPARQAGIQMKSGSLSESEAAYPKNNAAESLGFSTVFLDGYFPSIGINAGFS